MSAQDVLVRCSTLSGTWEALGSGGARGIVVEDLSMDADPWGPRSAQFVLKRNPQAIWPDISAFTPIEIEVGGIVVWEGRVKETPSKDGSDRQMSVSCEGWQYHLDDDPYRALYVSTRMADWVDVRGLTSTPLPSFPAIWNVAAGQAGISMVHPIGQALTANKDAAIVLDTGVTGGAKRIVLYATNTLWNVAATLYAKASDSLPMDLTGASSLITLSAGAVTNGVYAATFGTAGRYVMLQIDQGATTPVADNSLQFLNIYVFGDTTYEAFNASALQAHKVIKDSLNKATLLLSSDQSLIQSTTFLIPEFTPTGAITPREAINAANTYHSYQTRIARNRRFEFRPQPSSSIYEAPESSGVEFTDASANSGLDIYSGVNVTYTAADGSIGSVVRGQPSSLYAPSSIQPTNPGAEVDTSNWATAFGVGVLSRTTVAGEFSAGVAGFKVASAAAGGTQASTSAWTGGAFVAGRTYRLTIDIRDVVSPLTGGATASIAISGVTLASAQTSGAGTFQTVTLEWVQTSSTSPTLSVTGYGTAAFNYYFDNVLLYESTPTLVNRRGFRRTKILDTNMVLTSSAAQQIGDTYLTGHKTTPFRGSISVNGNASILLVQGGVMVPPAHLLFNTGELLRLPHLIDPDTGGIGREGRIAAVTCNPIQGTATIELDNQRSNFEALLSRLALVTGQVAAN